MLAYANNQHRNGLVIYPSTGSIPWKRFVLLESSKNLQNEWVTKEPIVRLYTILLGSKSKSLSSTASPDIHVLALPLSSSSSSLKTKRGDKILNIYVLTETILKCVPLAYLWILLTLQRKEYGGGKWVRGVPSVIWIHRFCILPSAWCYGRESGVSAKSPNSKIRRK